MYRKKNSLCLVRHKVPLECHSGECIFQQEFENTVPVRCYVCVWAKVRCLCGTSLCRTTFVIHSHSFGSTIFVTTFTRCAECPDSPPTDDTNWNRCVCVCVFAHAITNCGMGNVALARFHLLFHMRFVQMSLLQMYEYVTATLSIVVK